MSQIPRLYPRGFLLTPTSRRLPTKVRSPQTFELEGFSLHAEELAEVDTACRPGSWVAVIGKAWPLSTGIIPSDAPSVASAILDLAQGGSWVSTVDEALYDLGGRYGILIYQDGNVTAYNDACGNRSVFFSTAREISSHVHLLRDGLEDRTFPAVTGSDPREDLAWETTRSPYISALIPNHRITIGDTHQKRFFPLRNNRSADTPHRQKIDQAFRLWNEQLDRIVVDPAPKLMSITAGRDSRLMLAMAQNDLEHFTSFTYTTDEALDGRVPTTAWSRSGNLDQRGAELLADFLPSDHRVISIPADKTRDPGAIWADEHKNTLVRNAERSHNRRLLPRYLDEFSDPRAVHYRGNMLEIGRLHFRTTEGSLQQALKDLFSSFSKAAHRPPEQVFELCVSAMQRLEYERVPDDYDLTDIIYWEQRHGRWFAQVLSETDVAFDTVSPFNVRRIIDLFLSYSLAERSEAIAQTDLTFRASPELAAISINGGPGLTRQLDPKSDEATPPPSSHAPSSWRTRALRRRRTDWDSHYKIPVIYHPSLQAIDLRGPSRAVHSVEVDRDLNIDFFAKLEPARTLFVSLHGAVPEKSPRYPHFRRVSSMQNTVASLLCIADPTLSVTSDESLRLGWYTGSEDWDPTRDIGEVVRAAMTQIGAERVMFTGGSGGGFASLRLALEFPGSMAFVQDPQTDVGAYYPAHRERLARFAWPNSSPDRVFNEHPERFDMSHIYGNADPDVFIYYRQSTSDEWHVRNHAKPFEESLKDSPLKRSGRVRFVYENGAMPGHGRITPEEFNHHLEEALSFWTASAEN